MGKNTSLSSRRKNSLLKDANKQGISKNMLKKFFLSSNRFAGYGFNRSHAA